MSLTANAGETIYLPSEFYGHIPYLVLSKDEKKKEYYCECLVGNHTKGNISFEKGRYFSISELPYEYRTQRNTHIL